MTLQDGPGYWMHEVTGRLRPVITAYLQRDPLSPEQIALLRAYLRQWIEFPLWQGPDIARLRDMIKDLTSRKAIDDWLDLALDNAIDPL